MNHSTEQYLQMYHLAQSYLRLSRVYADYLGGLRWSSAEDALVYADGRFFAFSEAVAQFVEGFASAGLVPPFGYLLHWIDLLQNQRRLAAPAIQQLHRVFFATGGNWRNAGALAGILSRDVPEVPSPPDMAMVSKQLRDQSFPIRWFTSQFHEMQYPPEQPPLSPAEFEQDIIRKLEGYREEELHTWLNTGRGPIRDADRLAEELPLPRSLARALALLLERPRLAGAQTYVPQLVGALTLPPRRMTPQELPVGGYTDIVTRGQVEQLLPTQFALDELEFLRRFAEKELLYFRREEPPVQNRQELVVLLDQGVRTWGDVRLVLAAATLAFGKQALLRKMPFWLAATSTNGLVVDPTQEDEELLGELMEASDLSLNPGLALERVLETPSELLRDVVLLTHPRSLQEIDVLSAARRAGPRDRVFSVALDGHGQVAVSELRHGTPIAVRQFHIDFAPGEPAPARPPATGSASTPWTGDVESIPFPFRLGTEAHVTQLTFDDDVQWLLTVSGAGCLHLWKLDGSAQEMLPRPCRGEAIKRVLGILGVVGGFVVAGEVQGHLALAHYDLVRRRCTIYPFGRYSADRILLYYVRRRHRVIWIEPVVAQPCAVDLGTGKTTNTPIVDASASQPDLSILENTTERDLVVIRHDQMSSFISAARPERGYCALDAPRGMLTIQPPAGYAFSFTPTANGKPCFQHATIFGAGLAGATLALRAQRKDIGDSITLLQCPNGSSPCEFPIVRPKHKITRHVLSPDGSRIALLRTDHRVEVNPVLDPSLPTVCTRVGGYTMATRLYVGDSCILLNLGSSRQIWHLFDWADVPLEHFHERRAVATHEPDQVIKALSCGQRLEGSLLRLAGLADTILPCMAEDIERYVSSVWHGRLGFVLDRFGQVAVLDEGMKVVAMFIAFRDRYAAWLPDGTCMGSLTLNLGAASPDAAEKIAETLLRAERQAPG